MTLPPAAGAGARQGHGFGQPPRPGVRPGADCARTKTDHHVTGPCLGCDQTDEVILARKGNGVTMSMPHKTRHQFITRGTRDRVLTCGVDLGNAHHVGLVETRAEIVEKA